MLLKNNKKIHIGIVCSPWLGGSGVVGSQLAKYLKASGRYDVTFIGSEFPFKLEEGDVAFYKINPIRHPLFLYPLSEESLVQGIVKAVVEKKIDIIHAHFAIPFAHCALQAKEILKKMGKDIKVVTTLHGTDVLTLGQEVPEVMKYILSESDALTAVSNDLASQTKKLFHVKNSIQVVYNFINLSEQKILKNKENLRSKYALPEEKIFVHISNFRRIKRVRDTLKVFYKVKKKIPAKLLLIGDGPEIQTAKEAL